MGWNEKKSPMDIEGQGGGENSSLAKPQKIEASTDPNFYSSQTAKDGAGALFIFRLAV